MRCWFRLIAALGALLALLGAAIGAQTRPARFDVVSVRANRSGSTAVTNELQATSLTIINMPLRPIIQLAWGINTPSRLVGVPDWAQVERFDVIGKAAALGSREALRPMLQAMLVDRFKLAARLETRPMPIYVLVRARQDGALGPGLRPSTITCAGRGAPPPADGAPVAVPCGPRPAGPGRLVIAGLPIAQWSPVLSLMVQRPVVDKTGLDGRYDIDLTFAPDRQLPGAAAALPAPSEGPSLFTALQEQLGLRLEPATEAAEVLVIDHLERPTEN